MIHDDYTREWDAQESARNRMSQFDKITRTAAALGLEIEFYDRGSDVTTKLHFPNGQKFGYFYKLKTALKWAEKWKK